MDKSDQIGGKDTGEKNGIDDEKIEERNGNSSGNSMIRDSNSNSGNEKRNETDTGISASLNGAANNVQHQVASNEASINAVPNQPNPDAPNFIRVPDIQLNPNKQNRTNDSKTEQIEVITLSGDDDSPTNSSDTLSVSATEKRLDKDFFVDENHQTFSNFFTAGDNDASIWQFLTVYVPEDGGTMTFLFNGITVSLPHLNTLTLHFCKEDEKIVSYGGLMNRFNVHFVPFFQLLLNGAPELQDFETIGGRPPRGMGYLALPPTLTRVTFGCEMNDKELEMLIKNELPVLQTLYLLITNTSISEHILTRIFGKFSSSIRKLGFLGKKHIENPRNPSYFRFTKILEHLEVLETNSIHAELADGQIDLQNWIPNVRKLQLADQNHGMFCKWTAGSCYRSVNELLINLVREDFPSPSSNFTQTLSGHLMHSVILAFPKVSTLRLTVSCHDKSGLQCVFRNMPQLIELEIRVNNKEIFTNTDHWDATLTGILNNKGREPSLIRLKSLDSLSLLTETTENREAIISDFVFREAFNKMPDLKHLRMEGNFMASQECIDLWKTEVAGRIFSYNSGNLS